jgi:NADP-dependent 3-hydroxy acid dehydrogenase YdfG
LRVRRVKPSARTVIITGASAGVGRAIAHRFAREGDRVGLIARDAAALKDVQRELQASGAKAVARPWNGRRLMSPTPRLCSRPLSSSSGG